MTEQIPEPVEPVTWGCTVDDVLRLLPGVTVQDGQGTGPSNPAYQGTGRKVTREDVQEYIHSVASRVSARVWRYEQAPERTRENVRIMARDLVANGAAHYVQSAVFPGSTSPNNGFSYADRLWQRFQTDLDAVVAQIDDAVENPGVDPETDGRVYSSAPAPFFSDVMRF